MVYRIITPEKMAHHTIEVILRCTTADVDEKIPPYFFPDK